MNFWWEMNTASNGFTLPQIQAIHVGACATMGDAGDPFCAQHEDVVSWKVLNEAVQNNLGYSVMQRALFDIGGPSFGIDYPPAQ